MMVVVAREDLSILESSTINQLFDVVYSGCRGVRRKQGREVTGWRVWVGQWI